MINSIPILLPTLHPVIQPLRRSRAVGIGNMEFVKSVRAVLEVGCVIPFSVVVIAEPFHAVLELPAIDTGLQDSLYLVFVVIRTSAIASPLVSAAAIGLCD